MNVAITQCSQYHRDLVHDAVEQICIAAGMPDFSGQSVLIKPNILADTVPEKATTTHPEVVRAVINAVRKRGAAHIAVGDSPGLHMSGFIPKNCGIQAICDEEHVPWIDFTLDPDIVKLPGFRKKTISLAKAVREFDVIISVCKMKSHQLMYTTGAVKNLFGLMPGLSKSPQHLAYPTRSSFAELIAGIYELATPVFSIADAIVSMEGPGPQNGTPRHTGLLFASRDATALDVAQAIVMGYDPLSLPLTQTLLRRKLTTWHTLEDISYPLLNPNNLILSDFERIDQDRNTYFTRAVLFRFIFPQIRRRKQKKQPKPLFIKERCIGCARCVKICPAKVLTLEKDQEHHPQIAVQYKSCVRCYCCHEICPVDAIAIEKQ